MDFSYPPTDDEVFSYMLDKYIELLQASPESVARQEIKMTITNMPASYVHVLCDRVRGLISIEPTVIKLLSPIVVVGDLHGHFLDLIRILQAGGLPNPQKYLFLGDIVDRGDFSLETILFIFLLKVQYPLNVFIIRGNHEFDFLCRKHGFLDELHMAYTDKKIYYSFLSVFNMLSLAAVIDKNTLCVHGGIGPQVQSLEQIENLDRPIDSFDNEIVNSILWSDPSEVIDQYAPSPRGTGYIYGQNAVLDFLEASNTVRIIRAHECVNEGFVAQFNDHVVTVFSASNYCGISNNESAIFILDPNGEDEIKKFPPLPFLRRSNVVFVDPPFDTKPVPIVGSSRSAGNITFNNTQIYKYPPPKPSKFVLNDPKPVTPALHRLQEIRKRHELNKSTSFSSQKWEEINSILSFHARTSTPKPLQKPK